MKQSELKGNLILLLTALIWGCAFVAQSVSMDYIGPFTFQSIRSLMGAAVLIPVYLFLDNTKKKNGIFLIPLLWLALILTVNFAESSLRINGEL